ncbi:MAG: glycosyltransferase [Planctomycetes bacterium]|nr:glycosyltransferase [Planctomycetota bacterium]
MDGPVIGQVCLYAYFALLALLCGYGFHRYLMVYLYYRHRRNGHRPPGAWGELPAVTVQLPVYNELYVVERLIDAACRLDYPRDKLEIQVLDDSSDETQGICRRKVESWRAQGVDIVYLHRTDRAGYKAGALDHGMKVMKGRFVAVFDADFLPPPDFLMRTIHHFTDERIGMVQTRWGHINREYSLLTRIQSILLDGHFMMEHCARNRSGRFFNFSGTAGIWRREAIETAGGWQHDTLTEDLDLSFRSQLGKWKFVFLPEVETPAELPVEMNGFKSQQHRWVKGSMQTTRKLLWKVLTADVPLYVKAEGFVHLTGNIAYFIIFILSLLMFPVAYFRTTMKVRESAILDLGVFTLATISVCVFYLCSQKEIHGFRRCLKTALYVPLLLSLGIGMCVSNTRAVLEGLLSRHGGEFVRTPKYAIADRRHTFAGKKYKVAMRWMVPALELLLGLGFAGIVAYSAAHEMYGAIPFQALFMIGFFYVSFLSFHQGRVASK